MTAAAPNPAPAAPARRFGRRRRPAGPSAILESLVVATIPMARRAAAIKARKVPHLAAELESAAMLGLAEAARSFEPARGVKFATHAAHRIKGAMLDAMRVEAPKGYRRLDGARPRVVALEAPVAEGLTLGETLAVAARPEPRMRWSGPVAAAVARLPGRERAAVTLAYLRGLSTDGVAREMGITAKHARALRNAALARLRDDPRIAYPEHRPGAGEGVPRAR